MNEDYDYSLLEREEDEDAKYDTAKRVYILCSDGMCGCDDCAVCHPQIMFKIDMSEKPKSAIIGVGSGPWLAALREFEKLVWDRHDDFLARFARGPAFELTQLAVDSENVRLVYILDSGQHIADSVKLADILQWLSANNGVR